MEQQIDKSARSCFVGNIPYEATEEKLKEIFSSVGPIVSFKLVYDRENGKPRGYGFCEFMDPETALSAMRNLNGVEVSGRALRVDSASTERSELQNMQAGAGPGAGPAGVPPGPGAVPEPSAFGSAVDPEKAPEAITKAVASLPPEQMFELMKQMKDCIVNNPQEARDMLLKNPQLAYALLQALVVMKVVDPDTSMSMLHKQAGKPGLSGAQSGNERFNRIDQHPPPHFGGPVVPTEMDRRDHRDSRDMRGDPRENRDSRESSRDNRDPRDMREHRDPRDSRDSRERFPPDPRERFSSDRDSRERDPRPDTRDPRGGHRDPRDPRGGHRDPRDPRGGGSGPSEAPGHAIPPQFANSDPDKAQLIMQVLQLTEAQIAMLPTEQQASILELKKQIGNK